MANRRASTIELILLSAIVYAAIPVVLSELDTELVSSFPICKRCEAPMVSRLVVI